MNAKTGMQNQQPTTPRRTSRLFSSKPKQPFDIPKPQHLDDKASMPTSCFMTEDKENMAEALANVATATASDRTAFAAVTNTN
jgi:hypothetical protein